MKIYHPLFCQKMFLSNFIIDLIWQQDVRNTARPELKADGVSLVNDRIKSKTILPVFSLIFKKVNLIC